MSRDPSVYEGGSVSSCPRKWRVRGLPSYVSPSVLGQYDQGRSFYNGGPGLRRWRAALARVAASGTAARATFLGDSITIGWFGGAPLTTNGYVGRLRAKFDAKYGTAGTGIQKLSADSNESYPGVTIGSGWSALAFGPFDDGSYGTNASGKTITFTPTINVDSFTIYYVKAAACGTFTASVDGGAATSINSYMGGSGGVGKTTIAAGALGAHTLTITSPSDGNYAIIYAVEATVGSSGVRVGSLAGGGSTVDRVSGNGTATGAMPSMIDNIGSDLTVLMFSSNDYNQSKTIASFKTAIATVAARTASNNSDLLLVPDPERGAGPAVPNPQALDYTAAMYEAADAAGAALLDLNDRWGSVAIAKVAPYSYYNADSIHPSAKGQADIANALWDVLVTG